MTDKCLKLLHFFNSRQHLSVSDLATIFNTSPFTLSDEFIYLKEKGFIVLGDLYSNDGKSENDVSTRYKISESGRAYLTEDKKAKKHHLFNEVRAWITLAIAIIALIKSFTI